MDVYRILDQARFFDGISEASKRTLTRFCMPVERPRQSVLFREGESGEAMYLLARGRISLGKVSEAGDETVIKVLKPGEVFAEVVLFEQREYPVTAVALTDVLVMRLLRRDLLDLLGQQDFRNDFIAMLLRKQRYLTDRIQQLTRHDVAERLRAFLAEQYGERLDIAVEMNKKQLAAAIGATPETLSRLLQDLNRRGLLTWKQRAITVSPRFWKPEE